LGEKERGGLVYLLTTLSVVLLTAYYSNEGRGLYDVRGMRGKGVEGWGRNMLR